MELVAHTYIVFLSVQMAASLKQTVSLMSKVTANMPLTETSKLMDSLEKNFEDLEVKTKVMDDAMQNATTVQQPVDQVANLMQEMADEAGIELNLNMPVAPAMGTSVAMKEQVRRLARPVLLIGRFSSGRTQSAAGEIT
jgi:charged multivesicular body protein 1